MMGGCLTPLPIHILCIFRIGMQQATTRLVFLPFFSFFFFFFLFFPSPWGTWGHVISFWTSFVYWSNQSYTEVNVILYREEIVKKVNWTKIWTTNPTNINFWVRKKYFRLIHTLFSSDRVGLEVPLRWQRICDCHWPPSSTNSSWNSTRTQSIFLVLLL